MMLVFFGGSVLLCYHRQLQILNNLLTENLSPFFMGFTLSWTKLGQSLEGKRPTTSTVIADLPGMSEMDAHCFFPSRFPPPFYSLLFISCIIEIEKCYN